MPTFTNLFDGFGSKQTIFVGSLNCAVTIILSTMLALYNAVKLYAGNTRRRLLNNSIIILGIASAISIVCDVDNIQVYMATVYLVAGVPAGEPLCASSGATYTYLHIFLRDAVYRIICIDGNWILSTGMKPKILIDDNIYHTLGTS